jgi:hypothetical protein
MNAFSAPLSETYRIVGSCIDCSTSANLPADRCALTVAIERRKKLPPWRPERSSTNGPSIHSDCGDYNRAGALAHDSGAVCVSSLLKNAKNEAFFLFSGPLLGWRVWEFETWLATLQPVWGCGSGYRRVD